MIIHGLSDCYYVFSGTVKPLPGAVSLSIAPKLTTAFDTRVRGGGKAIRYINEGYDGNIELVSVPFNFYEDIFGWSVDSDGTMTEKYISSNQMNKFSLMWTTNGQREILWECVAGVPTITRKTDNKGYDIQTVSIPIYARRDANMRVHSTNHNPSSTAYTTYFGMVSE